jgi:hypothetical protein
MSDAKCTHENTFTRYDFSIDMTFRMCKDCGEVIFIKGDNEHDNFPNSSN